MMDATQNPNWWAALAPQQSQSKETARQQMLAAAESGIDFSALAPAAAAGAKEALTDPSTYLEAAMMIPGNPLRGGNFSGVNSVRNSAPNWVRGEAGKGGKGWRWGKEGPPSSGNTQQVRVQKQSVPEKGGLPAVQGGLPATQGGLPAVIPAAAQAGKGGLPAVIPQTSRTLPKWLAGLAGGAGWLIQDTFGPEEPEEEVPLNYPSTGGMSFESSEKFEFPEAIETAREVLPQVDWENLTEVDYGQIAQVLSGLAPDKPTERNWLQNLAGWAAPALAMGTLLGPAGLLIGGLMGEGGRQTREQQRDEAYRTDLREWQAGLAEDLMKLQGLQRGQELETQQGIRSQAEGNFNFETGQEDRDAGRTQVRNQQMLDEVSAQRQMMEMDQMRRQQQLQAMLLNGGAGVDDSEVLMRFVQTNPQIYQELQANPLFQQWQMSAGNKAPGSEFNAQANLAELMRSLEGNPRYAPILQQLRQQLSMSSFLAR